MFWPGRYIVSSFYLTESDIFVFRFISDERYLLNVLSHCIIRWSQKHYVHSGKRLLEIEVYWFP